MAGFTGKLTLGPKAPGSQVDLKQFSEILQGGSDSHTYIDGVSWYFGKNSLWAIELFPFILMNYLLQNPSFELYSSKL